MLNNIAVALIMILFVSCVPNKYARNNPAVLPATEPVNKQVEYIEKMDQADRKKIYNFWIGWFPNGKRAKLSRERDAMRTSRILALLDEDVEMSGREKLSCALVLFHSASEENFNKAIMLCKDVMKNGETDEIKIKAKGWHDLFSQNR